MVGRCTQPQCNSIQDASPYLDPKLLEARMSEPRFHNDDHVVTSQANPDDQYFLEALRKKSLAGFYKNQDFKVAAMTVFTYFFYKKKKNDLKWIEF